MESEKEQEEDKDASYGADNPNSISEKHMDKLHIRRYSLSSIEKCSPAAREVVMAIDASLKNMLANPTQSNSHPLSCPAFSPLVDSVISSQPKVNIKQFISTASSCDLRALSFWSTVAQLGKIVTTVPTGKEIEWVTRVYYPLFLLPFSARCDQYEK